MAKRKRSSGTFLFGLIVAALAAVGWGAGPGAWFQPSEDVALKGVPVQRGDMRISAVARGNLEANDSVRLVNELEGRATILFLIEEGASVEPGDLVCELDVSDLRDRRVTQEIAVKNAEAEFTKAKEQYDIQEIQNVSDIAEAELALQLAELDLEKYTDEEGGEWTHELAQAIEAITIAEEERKQAEDTLKWTTSLHEKGFVERTELERDQLALQKYEIKLEQAQRDKALKEKYGDQRKRAELQADVETRKRDITKVEKQALARLADYDAARASSEFELTREREKLAKLGDQIGKARIVTPEAGIIVYSRSKRGRMGFGSGEIPELGGEVHERQEIATIPRAGGMVADVSLHETKLEKIRLGQRCVISVDALPGQLFGGEVGFLAAVADSGSWMTNPNQRLYKTTITLTDSVPQMRPGMSCSVEILVDDLEDVLFVPRQAVFLDGDRTICFVDRPGGVETRQVAVGQDNNKRVEIRSGLELDDVVLLSPPATWEPAPASEPALDVRAKGPDETMPLDPTARDQRAPAMGGEGRGRPAGGDRRDWQGGREGRGGGAGSFSPEMIDAMRAMREGGGRPSAEQMAEFMKNLSPEQRERLEAATRRREQRGEGPPPGREN